MVDVATHLPITAIAQSSGVQENPHSNTRNRKWEIAVAVPVPNRNLSEGKTYSYLTTNIFSEKINISTDKYSKAFEVANSINSMLAQNELVTCQISQLDRSYTQTIKITGAGVDTINSNEVVLSIASNINSNITASNSIVDIPVTTIAKSWATEFSTIDGIIPISLRKNYVGHITSMIGDYSAQELFIPHGKYDTNIKYFVTEIDLSSIHFPPLAQMRIGCMYNVKFEDANGIEISPVGKVQLHFGVSSDSKISDLNNNAYGDTYTVINSGPFPALSSNKKIKIGISFVNTSGAQAAVRFWLDSIWVEQDYGLQTGGAITIDDYPIRSSLSYNDMDDINMTRLKSGDFFLSTDYISKNSASKWVINAEFKTLNSVYNYFKYMEQACRNGHLINLHPKLPEVPEVLLGKIRVKDLGKQNFSFNRTNFKVSFYEV